MKGITSADIDRVLGQTRVKKPRKTRRPGTSGKGLEAMVLSSQQGATLSRCPNGVRYIGGGKTIPVKSPVDFYGVLHATGRAIVFDAKESGEAISFDCSTSILKEHQRLQVVRMGEAGAVSGLLILSTRTNRLHWLGWLQLHPRRPTYPFADMVDVGPAGVAIDWHRIIRAGSAKLPSGESEATK